MIQMSPLQGLIARFTNDWARLTTAASGYTETEARVEYIDPLLSLLGWDMVNANGQANSLKDVVREATHEAAAAGATSQRPDYTFRIAGVRKFFVEAKKPSVDITNHKPSAFQIRQYGYTVGLPVSILTNFRAIRIYDTTLEPKVTDDADVGLIKSIELDELPSEFQWLTARFGRNNVATGSIERHFGTPVPGTMSVGDKFLARINDWRLRLANDLHDRYAAMPVDSLSDLCQKVINRVIFIRMCEDRGIEGRETLKKAAAKNDFIELRALFKRLDDRYNTGLFDVQQDRLQDSYLIDAALFGQIVDEVYSPTSPYSFAVLDAEFLGQVYELFLAKRLRIEGSGVTLVNKQDYEDREVVTTPQLLVDQVVQRAIAARLSSQRISTFDELAQLRILDIAVGSGRFLVHAADKLVDLAVAVLSRDRTDSRVYENHPGSVRLRFDIKKKLLQNCLYGIDIDYNAIEVARFSLIIKLLEDETAETLPSGTKLLPNFDANLVWGNSIVGDDFHTPSKAVFDKTVAINWSARGLPSFFDVIVGNPPYVKTEEMKGTRSEEFDYYKTRYKSAHRQFDKYFVFLERALEAASSVGSVGFVIPNKWMTNESGSKLRELLSRNNFVFDIVDFGNENLFAGKSAYTCILVLMKAGSASFSYRHVNSQVDFELDPHARGLRCGSALLSVAAGAAWLLPGNVVEDRILSRLKHRSTPLFTLIDVRNGIQTSRNSVFVIKNFIDNGTTVSFDNDGRRWTIESAITRPYVEDSGVIRSYWPVKASARVIFPYESFGGCAPRIISAHEMQMRFPLAWAYLSHFKAELSKRSVARPGAQDIFYAFGRHQALDTVFRFPKIVYSVNQTGGKYGVDTEGVAVASGGTAGEVMLLNPQGGYALEFFLGLLNQRAIEFYVRKRGSPFKGGYYSRGTAVMAEVPVPVLDLVGNPAHRAIHDAIVADVRRIQDSTQDLVTAVGRKLDMVKRDLEWAHRSLKQKFDQLWGFGPDDLDDLILPGE